MDFSDKDAAYTYIELDGRPIIRILELIPSVKERLECIIKHVELGSIPYQSLSYAWGNPEKLFKVFVRDASGKALGYIPITKNVNNAITDLQDSLDITYKVFWIDQLCIDQHNDIEKGRQVALMGDIYEKAISVIMYLGPSSPQDRRVPNY
jgi:hypothetical protein